MEPLSVALEANVQAFDSNIAKAIQSVQNFGNQAEKIPTVRPKFEDTISRTLNDLTGKFRVAQGNAEIFGNQLEADRLKVVAMQQALNQLLSAGLSPTSKEVLKLADDIESLSAEITQAEKAASRADLFASFQKTGRIIPDLEAKAQRLRTAMRNATDVKDIERYQKRLQAVNNELAELGQRGSRAAIQTAGGMNRLAGSAYTVNAEFSRIIQDAPYGMMGIGNNIQQLTANFGQLSQQAGGAGAAMKAAFASMLTPASLLTLGIAAVTSGWVLYQQWSQRSAKSTKEAANAMQDAASKAKEYINSLDAVNRARATGQREAQQELTTLKLLYERTQDVSLSMKERVKAVDELQKQYPEYFKNLKDEDILAGNASEAYRKLSKSIQDYATAQASLSLITEKAQQRQVNLLQLRDLREQEKRQDIAIKQAQQLKAAQDEAAASMNSRGGTGSVLGAQNVLKLNNALEETQGKIAAIIAENRKLDEEMELLTSDATPALFTDDPAKGTKEATDHLKELREGWNLATKQAILFGSSYDELGNKSGLLKTAMVGLMEQGLKPQDALIQKLVATYDFFSTQTLDKTGTAIQRFIDTDLAKLKEELAKLGLIKVEPIKIPPLSDSFNEQYNKDVLEAMKNRIEVDFGEIGIAARHALAQGIGNVAELLGQALAGSDVTAGQYVAAFLTPFADMAVQMGKQLILMGMGIAAVKESLKTLNPGVAIAAGAALVAIGSAAKSALGNLAGGGAAPSVSTSSISGTASGPMGISYEGDDELRFRIEGNDLVAVMDRANYKTRRTRG